MSALDAHGEPEHELLVSERLNDSTGFQLRATRCLGIWQTARHRLEIYDTPQYGCVLRADGANLTSEREEFVCHENLVHPALSAHAAPGKVLIVGGADGGAAEETLKHPSIREVLLFEPDAELLRVARQHFSSVYRGAFDDPRLSVRQSDGHGYLRSTADRFDLVVFDPGSPAAPAGELHSLEFLERCRLALAPGGALVLPLGLPTARPEGVAELAQRLNGLFRIVRPYTFYVALLGAPVALAVCSDKLDPKSFTADEIDRRIGERRLPDLRFYNGETHEGVFALPNYLRDLVTPPRVRQPLRSRRLGIA